MTVIEILTSLAQYGHAPIDGCDKFGANFDDAFNRLRKEYLNNQFSAGMSAEKFVIGPYGSGKTHFLRHFSTIARDNVNCITGEVILNKDINFTDNIAKYCEIARDLNSAIPIRGIRGLLIATVNKIKGEGDTELLIRWINSLSLFNFKERKFGKVVQKALLSLDSNDEDIYDASCCWLEGEVDNIRVCNTLGLDPIRQQERNSFGRRLLLSLCQFIKKAGFQGTVISFDEAEQSMNVDRRHRERILSMIQSDVNAVADTQGGSALLIYAITPDIADRLDEFPAVQQRLSDPISGRNFFTGETLSPKIDLRNNRYHGINDLYAIGDKMVEMLLQSEIQIQIEHQQIHNKVKIISDEVWQNDMSTSNRRTMVKTVAATLLNLINNGNLEITTTNEEVETEPEV